MFITSCIALAALSQTSARTYNGKLGQFYLIGPESFVIGTRERLEPTFQREIAIRGVRTTLAIGTYLENIVASKGKQLIVFTGTIRASQRHVTDVSSNSTFGFRVYDTKFKSGDITFRGSYSPTHGELDHDLQKGQTADFISVYEFPDTLEHLRIAPYFHTFLEKQSPKFDLTAHFKKGDSVFATGPLSHGAEATVKAGQAFLFEEITMKFGSLSQTQDKGYAIPIELTTEMQKPVDWGWQYATVEVFDNSGIATKAYPSMYIPESTQFIAPQFVRGQRVVAEYRFYPKEGGKPVKLKLTRLSTGRSVTVTGI